MRSELVTGHEKSGLLAASVDRNSIKTAEIEGAKAKGDQDNGQAAGEDVLELAIQKTESLEEVGSKILLEPHRLSIEQRRKEPIYQIKPIALVESEMDYDYCSLEESLINFLLEKVVVMREVPFVRAMEQLERNTNVNKIYD